VQTGQGARIRWEARCCYPPGSLAAGVDSLFQGQQRLPDPAARDFNINLPKIKFEDPYLMLDSPPWFLGYSALAPAHTGSSAAFCRSQPHKTQTPLRLAVIGNTYRYGSGVANHSRDRFPRRLPARRCDWHVPNV